MTEQRDRYDRFAEAFAEQVRRAARQARAGPPRPGASRTSPYDPYLVAVQDLFTRGVTPDGMRELMEHETRATYRFFTREVQVDDLVALPWFKRYPLLGWRVFEAMAYRLSPARRVLFAAAVPLLFAAWSVYFLHVVVQGGWTASFVTWEGVVVAVGSVLFFLLLLELKDKLGLKSDLEVARQIQFGLLPFEPWQRGETGIVTAMRPANTVGGDYFDIVDLGGERTAIVIADVAGKGMPAALLMALLQGSLRTLLTAGLRGADLVAKLNVHLCSSIPSNRLITLFYAEMDLGSGAFSYVNAGHNPPFVVRGTGPLERLHSTGMALGILPEATFTAEETLLESGDRLLLYTDGVTEAEGPNDEEYGDERLGEFLEAHRNGSPRAMIDELLADVLRHCGPERPRDDITLMAVTRSAPPPSS
jgi:sigma-B regulation protein RsbU (phosphoserine phosphatase)